MQFTYPHEKRGIRVQGNVKVVLMHSIVNAYQPVRCFNLVILYQNNVRLRETCQNLTH